MGLNWKYREIVAPRMGGGNDNDFSQRGVVDENFRTRHIKSLEYRIEWVLDLRIIQILVPQVLSKSLPGALNPILEYIHYPRLYCHSLLIQSHNAVHYDQAGRCIGSCAAMCSCGCSGSSGTDPRCCRRRIQRLPGQEKGLGEPCVQLLVPVPVAYPKD